jgi:5'/3'-nucleotidase SurE
MRTRSRLPLLAPLIAIFVLALAEGGFAQGRPLKILLTNDDGYDSTGLKVMQAALAAAGHQVTVVAPATNQSSTSMSMTSGAIKVEPKGGGVWAVHGTPADAAMIGLMHVLRDTPQDLVISGTNAGHNLGTSTTGSGTVGAAIVSARYGLPAIATSAGTGNAADAYGVAADLTVQMIRALDAGRPAGGRLLPDRLVINLNVPAIPAAQLKGIRWAPLSRVSAYRRQYTTTANPNEVMSRLVGAAPDTSETTTDVALVNQGYVTLTVLDGDMSVDAGSTTGTAISSRLSGLALTQPVGAR